MRRLIAFGAGLALAGVGCRRAEGTRQQQPLTMSASPSPVSSAAVATASSPLLVPAGATEVAGLKVTTGSIRGASLWGFSDLRLDLSKVRLRIVTAERGAPLATLLPEGALAVLNGGYFEADFRPSAWLKSDGKELAPKISTARGGVLAVGATGVYLGTFAGLGFEPRLAIQSYPLIVEPEGKSGIRRDDGRRAARTIVCLKGRDLHFVVIAAPRGEGPTLYESAALLREPAPRGFGCTRALNLDGGPSSGVWFGPEVPARQREPLALVAYGIAIEPR
jgi:hypothetical protein